MRLKKLELKDFSVFKEMATDYFAAGNNKYYEQSLSFENFSGYINKLAQCEKEETTPVHLVPSICYWLVDDVGVFHGGIRLRTRLNEPLKIEGGHIGYDVKPTSRNKGYATVMLSLCLDFARQLGLRRVLVTCFVENIASAKVIEKNGGILESIEKSPRNNKNTKRYWIDLV